MLDDFIVWWTSRIYGPFYLHTFFENEKCMHIMKWCRLRMVPNSNISFVCELFCSVSNHDCIANEASMIGLSHACSIRKSNMVKNVYRSHESIFLLKFEGEMLIRTKSTTLLNFSVILWLIPKLFSKVSEIQTILGQDHQGQKLQSCVKCIQGKAGRGAPEGLHCFYCSIVQWILYLFLWIVKSTGTNITYLNTLCSW